MTLKVGITGGIGSGKSLICKIFQTLGIPVYDSDSRAKHLMQTDKRIVEALSAIFGSEVYTDKKLNRSFIAGKIFRYPEMRDKVNQIVHPVVREDFDHFFQRNVSAPYVLQEAAILFESGAHKAMDFSITVTAPDDIRIQRIKERDYRSEAEIKNIINSQASDKSRIELSDFIIYNNEQQMVIPQVLHIDKTIRKKL
jgi:dephospho-CoA kinase